MRYKSFWGNDEDYGNPYQYNRYDEPDSDRGSSDEFGGGFDIPSHKEPRFRKGQRKLW